MQLSYVNVALIALIAGACWSVGAWVARVVLGEVTRKRETKAP